MYYLLLTLGSFIIGGFIYRNEIKNKYDKFKTLTNLVNRIDKKSNITTICSSMKIIYKMLLFKCVLFLNRKNLERINDNSSILTYYLDGRMYKIVLDHRKGPALVLLITDENQEDITTKIVPFLGPKRDWHKREFTPIFWGKKNLTFYLSDGQIMNFMEEEIIKLI